MFDYNQFNSTYEVDLAILSAVTSGGGGGGGVTPQQVSTMIDSALTPYSTTSQVNGMIASGTSGLTTTQQVDNQISSALTGYSTTSQVEGMISASAATKQEYVWYGLEIAADGTVTGGNGYWINNAINNLSYTFGSDYDAIKCEASGQTYFGRIISKVNYEGETDIWEFTGIINIADVTYLGIWGVDGDWTPYLKSFTELGAGGSKSAIKFAWDSGNADIGRSEFYDIVEYYANSGTGISNVLQDFDVIMTNGAKKTSSCSFIEFTSDDKVRMWFPNCEGGFMLMGEELSADGSYQTCGVQDISGILNSKLSGQGVAVVRALTQQEYDDEGSYDSTTLYVIKPSNN